MFAFTSRRALAFEPHVVEAAASGSLSSANGVKQLFVYHFEALLTVDDDGTAFYIEVPGEILTALSDKKRPPVVVTLNKTLNGIENEYEYRTTVATYGGRFYLPVRREIREAAKLVPGASVDVGIALDRSPRVVDLPTDLKLALDANPLARAAFERLSYTHAREHVDWLVSAKRDETRRRRVEKLVSILQTEPDRAERSGRP